MSTDPRAYISRFGCRFITHFGWTRWCVIAFIPLDDQGMVLKLGGQDLLIIPGHFLHSCGNFHLYDPVSKIYYSGDLGASPGAPYSMVEDFEQHIQYMDFFHKRYIPTGKLLSIWVNTVKKLDIETICAPARGALCEVTKT